MTRGERGVPSLEASIPGDGLGCTVAFLHLVLSWKQGQTLGHHWLLSESCHVGPSVAGLPSASGLDTAGGGHRSVFTRGLAVVCMLTQVLVNTGRDAGVCE